MHGYGNCVKYIGSGFDKKNFNFMLSEILDRVNISLSVA